MLDLDRVGIALGGREVLRDVSLALEPGTLTVLTGPSGSGKSTTLALTAGLLRPDRGIVRLRAKRLGMQFQDPALLPWRTAVGNVAFALTGYEPDRARRLDRARHWLGETGLNAGDWQRLPRALSGGMRARVALARALAVAPDLLLLDEPFAALDPDLAARAAGLVRTEVDTRGTTALVVLHDRAQAREIADRIFVMPAEPGPLIPAEAVTMPAI